MDSAAEIKQHHGRIAAARRDITEYLTCFMPQDKVAEAMRMVNELCAMAHNDGASFGAARENVAQQLKAN